MGPIRGLVRPVLRSLLEEMKFEEQLMSSFERNFKFERKVSPGSECSTQLPEDVAKTLHRHSTAPCSIHSTSPRNKGQNEQTNLVPTYLSDMKAVVARIEKVLETKADQKGLDEMTETFKVSTRRMTQLLSQKVELSSLSRLEEQVQEQCRNVALLTPAQDDLQDHMNRTKDLIKQANDNLKSLQEVVAGKAEKSTVEELAYSISVNSGKDSPNSQALADLEAVVREHASSADLKAAVRDLEEKSEFKTKAIISEIRAALESKADRKDSTGHQEFQEMVTSFQIFKKTMVEQAEMAESNLQKLEALINQKGDHGVSDLHEDVAKLKDRLSQKADSHTLEEVGEKLKDRLLQKADSQTLEEMMKTVTRLGVNLRQNAEAQSGVECALEKLRQEHLDQAKSEDVAKKFEEVDLRFESIAGQLGMKLGRLGGKEGAASGKEGAALDFKYSGSGNFPLTGSGNFSLGSESPAVPSGSSVSVKPANPVTPVSPVTPDCAGRFSRLTSTALKGKREASPPKNQLRHSLSGSMRVA